MNDAKLRKNDRELKNKITKLRKKNKKNTDFRKIIELKKNNTEFKKELSGIKENCLN